MYYLKSRYFNPEWGRFINSDAIVGQVGVLLSHNVFAYCSNNSINLKDDTGFLACSAVDGVSDGGTSDRNVGDKPVGGQISSGNLQQRLSTFKDLVKSKFTNNARNPYGRSGGPLHQQTINNIGKSSDTSKMQNEYKISTPNGEKLYRFADKVEITNGEISRLYQVGRVGSNGMPVAREAKAIADIMASPFYNGSPIYFIPYNSPIGPILYVP